MRTERCRKDAHGAAAAAQLDGATLATKGGEGGLPLHQVAAKYRSAWPQLVANRLCRQPQVETCAAGERWDCMRKFCLAVEVGIVCHLFGEEQRYRELHKPTFDKLLLLLSLRQLLHGMEHAGARANLQSKRALPTILGSWVRL